MSFFTTKYRVCVDAWLGWEVQYRKWYSPFWFEVGFSNTFSTKEEAITFAKNHKNKIYL